MKRPNTSGESSLLLAPSTGSSNSMIGGAVSIWISIELVSPLESR